mmetsp:Transcript_2382/g.3523  ORF Transcript_2382/g.3523 Transcript_2382/m.3523 type:complete len:382 (+) Transcript_2382:1-1146(+)
MGSINNQSFFFYCNYSNNMIKSLPDHLLVESLMWVDPMDLLLSATRVSVRFASTIRDEHFWKLLITNLGSHEKADLSCLTLVQLQRCCLFQVFAKEKAANDDGEEEEKEKDKSILKALEFGSILPTKETSLLLKLGSFRTCLASTTDHENEFIENVISDRSTRKNYEGIPPLRRRVSYWSSKPSATPESDETLLFTTKYPDTLISTVRIKPLRDPYLGDRCYTWKNISIKAYRLPAEKLKRDHDNKEKAISTIQSTCAIHRNTTKRIYNRPPLYNPWNNVFGEGDADEEFDELLHGQALVYESEIFETMPANSVEWQQFDFPDGVIANAIVIKLMGKNSRQFDDSGYYVCTEKVDIQGMPLYKNLQEQKDWNTSRTIMVLK